MPIPETSLIPATISLLKFYQSNGFSSFFQNFPYWYFGEVPYRYLIGPITPMLFNNDVLVGKLIYFIPLFCVISSLGWSLLFSSFFKEKKFGIWLISFAILLLTPWKYVYGVGLSDFTLFFAKSLIPFYLLFLYKKKYILGFLSLCVILLINTNALASLFVFSIAIIIKGYTSRLKPLIYVILAGLLMATFWYGPLFWIKNIMNPSIGGRVGVSVIFGVLNFFKIVLPVLIAFFVVKFSGRLKRRLPIFILASLTSFSILSLYRFFSNPEFVFDWVSWFYEVEVSLGLLVSYAVYKRRFSYISLILLPLVFTVIISSKLKFEPASQSNILRKLADISGEDNVFLSGSTVFSAAIDTKLIQLRGGRDEVIKNADWLKASYVLRESVDTKELSKTLHQLKIKYVLVHTDSSSEYYKDFKNYDVWNKLGRVVYQDSGDLIYKID